MAGGDGERLWPLSLPASPKQFLTLFGGRSLLQQAADRLKGLIAPADTFVVTADRFVTRTRRELPALPRANVLGEPCRRNTAAAIALALGEIRRRYGDEVVVCVLTADHLIRPASRFRTTLRRAIVRAAAAPAIVTIGIVPTAPATQFGYIDSHARPPRFVEKPSLAVAKRYLASGRFLWNSGMFIFRAGVMVRELELYAPAVARLLSASRPRTLYRTLEPISIDYAVMEHTRRLQVVASTFVWSGVGSWTELARHFPADACGNVALGKVVLDGTVNALVYSDAADTTAVVGLKDVVVVRSLARTLVCSKSALDRLRGLPR